MSWRRDPDTPSETGTFSEAEARENGSEADTNAAGPRVAHPIPEMEQSVLKVDDDILFWERGVPADRGEPSSPDPAEGSGTHPSPTERGADSAQALVRWVSLVQEQLGDLPRVLEEQMASRRSGGDSLDSRIEARLSDLEEGIGTLRSSLDSRLAELARDLSEASADLDRRVEASARATEQRVSEIAAQPLDASLAATVKDLDARNRENSARLNGRLDAIERRIEDLARSIERRLGAYGLKIQSMTKLFAQVARALDSNVQADDLSDPRTLGPSEQAPGGGVGSPQVSGS
jgi:polyhydroxyalkanoate synthesis regulator phasin